MEARLASLIDNSNMTVVEDTSFVLDFTPSKFLDFALEDGEGNAECSLNLNNPGSTPVAFKVKTTKPKRYLVRPNQGVVQPGGQLTVSIVLLAQDKRELILEYRQTGTSSDTNKFMLQVLPLKDAGGTVLAVSAQTWESAKEHVQQKKLVVRFSFPRPGSRAAPAGADLKQTSNGIKNFLSNARSQSESEASDLTPSQLYEQSKELRQKYNDLVSFTINLTAEKDLILRSLNATKEELQREQKARKDLQAQMLDPSLRPTGGVSEKGVTSVQRDSGFSLFFILVVGVMALLLGQWTTSYYSLF